MKECGFYQVLVIRAGKRPWKLCLTPNCKSKEAWSKPFSEKVLPKKDDELIGGKVEPLVEKENDKSLSLETETPKKKTKKITKKK